MGKKSAPPPPDFSGVAEKQAAAQNQANTQNMWANRVNQSNPWGSSTWSAHESVDPTTGQKVTSWSQDTQLNPDQQAALNSQMQLQRGRSDLANSLMGQVGQDIGRGIDYGQFASWAQTPQGQQNPYTSAYAMGPQQQQLDTSRQDVPGLQNAYAFGNLQNVGDAASTRQRAEDAIYGSATSRLDPQWAQRQSQMESQLANQGISRNSAAYTRAMDDFNRSRTDAYQQASMGAITGGGAEASRDYSMNMGLRQQQAQEAMNQGNLYNQSAQAAFGMGGDARNQQLAAQQQAWQQGLQGGQFGLQQQQQAWGQGQDIYNNQLSSANYQNQLRQQQAAEAMQRQGWSLEQIDALMQGQGVQNPQFMDYGQMTAATAPDYAGAAQSQYQANADAYNAKQAQRNSLMGTIGTVGTAAAMFF